MRYMIMVRATTDTEAGKFPADDHLMADMAAFHEELQKAGVLLDANGLKPSAAGWRMRYGADGRRSVVDGPFAETRELIAGYTLIEVRNREEAMEWARRFPAPMGKNMAAEVEVRPLYEASELPPVDPARRVRDHDTSPP